MGELAAGFGWPPSELMQLTWPQVKFWLEQLDRMSSGGEP